MKILVIGDCLFVGAIRRSLRSQHQVACGNVEDMERWLPFDPEIVLVDQEAMGIVFLDVIRELQRLGYQGQVYLTQSEGMVPSRWVKALIEHGAVKGLLTKPWMPQDIKSWNEKISSPSNSRRPNVVKYRRSTLLLQESPLTPSNRHE